MNSAKSSPGATTGHRLEPLLNPASIAIIGASGREGRPGYTAILAAKAMGYAGALHPVTPTYEEIEGLGCYPDMASLPGPVDLAIIAGGTARMEGQLADAISNGARAALMFANAWLPEESDPPMRARIGDMAREADIPLLGPNTIGYVNYADGCAGTWVPPASRKPGPVAAIIQSGSTYSYANTLDPRVRFNLTIQPGQEAALTVAELMDYALEVPGTRALAVYLETVRHPEAFLAVLDRAEGMDVPVVVIRPGSSETGARHIVSHTGRLAGADAAFEAVFRRHGVIRVETMDEWWSTILLMSHDRRPGPGGVAGIMDSGGQRALLSDHAEACGVPWAEIGEETRATLRARLDLSLPAVNPVDAWAGDPDWPAVFGDCFQAVVADPDAAIGVVFTDFGANEVNDFTLELAKISTDAAAAYDKPIVAATYTARHFHPGVMLDLADKGIPVLDGGLTSLKAIGNAFAYRDFRARPREAAPAPADPDMVALWRKRLGDGAALDEAEALALLADFGVPTVAARVAESEDAALAAADTVGYPVAMKTAEPGIAHKTEADGVRLGLGDADAARAAYGDLAGRLGPHVTVAAMAPGGTEVALGVVTDPQFGPLVMVGAGGVLVELLDDRRFGLPPFGEAEAMRLIESLRVAKLLAGHRGEPAADMGALARAVSRLSVLADALRECVREIDVNPMIAGPAGAVAVDALVISHE